MDVLLEIQTWSEGRPDWQRDALRRMVVGSDLQNDDFEALTTICKSAYGLTGRQKSESFAKDHIPSDDRENGVVSLLDISHFDGVNALAQDQKISFGPGLTVVYGDNAAGKSGYTPDNQERLSSTRRRGNTGQRVIRRGTAGTIRIHKVHGWAGRGAARVAQWR